MKQYPEKKDWKFRIAVIIIVVLLLVIAGILLNPKLQGYIIQKQLEAKDLTLMYILQQVQQNGFVRIGIGNQSLVLVPIQQNPGQPQPLQ